MRIIGQAYSQIIQFQQTPYKLEEVPAFMEYARSKATMDDKELYLAAKKSMQLGRQARGSVSLNTLRGWKNGQT